ncbi:hypothetical protein GCM10009789_85160 [Kribbella sancticallisti]|uniref:Uncharacterized protein n=2 Tax=Kribbella sancticallisti TaxID=460087 RepID=A0ABP4QQ26_9ACTN
MHIDGKGACQAEEKHRDPLTGGQIFRRCKCQLYDGPEPLPEYYARELEG